MTAFRYTVTNYSYYTYLHYCSLPALILNIIVLCLSCIIVSVPINALHIMPSKKRYLHCITIYFLIQSYDLFNYKHTFNFVPYISYMFVCNNYMLCRTEIRLGQYSFRVLPVIFPLDIS